MFLQVIDNLNAVIVCIHVQKTYKNKQPIAIRCAYMHDSLQDGTRIGFG